MKSVQSVDPIHSLEKIRRQFDRWRAVRTGRGHTPEELRCRAVDLLEHHRAFHVCRALGINATALKRWAADQDNRGNSSINFTEMPSFVALDAAAYSPAPSASDNRSMPTSRLMVELPGCIRVHCDTVNCVSELLEALGVHNAVAGTR